MIDDDDDGVEYLGKRQRRRVQDLSVNTTTWTIACAIFKCKIMVQDAFPSDADMVAHDSFSEANTFMATKRRGSALQSTLEDAAAHTVSSL